MQNTALCNDLFDDTPISGPPRRVPSEKLVRAFVGDNPDHLTVDELKARGSYHWVILMVTSTAHEEVAKCYEAGSNERSGYLAVREFIQKIRTLKGNQSPQAELDKFLKNYVQGDFLDYRRRDFTTLRNSASIERKRKKRAALKAEEDPT